jgi:hypothetical protein
MKIDTTAMFDDDLNQFDKNIKNLEEQESVARNFADITFQSIIN